MSTKSLKPEKTVSDAYTSVSKQETIIIKIKEINIYVGLGQALVTLSTMKLDCQRPQAVLN